MEIDSRNANALTRDSNSFSPSSNSSLFEAPLTLLSDKASWIALSILLASSMLFNAIILIVSEGTGSTFCSDSLLFGSFVTPTLIQLLELLSFHCLRYKYPADLVCSAFFIFVVSRVNKELSYELVFMAFDGLPLTSSSSSQYAYLSSSGIMRIGTPIRRSAISCARLLLSYDGNCLNCMKSLYQSISPFVTTL